MRREWSLASPLEAVGMKLVAVGRQGEVVMKVGVDLRGQYGWAWMIRVLDTLLV